MSKKFLMKNYNKMERSQYFCIVILVLLQTSFCQEFNNDNELESNDFDWDYLVYSQRWPITGCAEWEEKNKANTCNLPSNNSIWTVHGLWPNKIGKEGPFNCPSAIHFDPTQLEPIMDELKARWVNIEANTNANSFWKHEWDKHGTCASQIPQLNSIVNYFSQGLELNLNYDIPSILSQGGIVPKETGYNVHDINKAIMSTLNKRPVIECEVDRRTKEVLLNEIRICFNKSLELVDCMPQHPIHFNDSGDMLTNCKLDKPVMYYSELPSYYADFYNDFTFYEEYDKKLKIHQLQRHYKFREDLLDLYKFVKLLIWLSI
ncbi:unnamed protein product [Brassicogethes aeneus]|uniref:Uncharacterized protein n=1 Tax=Brassicogethes aeneus TaxID=1431903 RepID=A0A9P0FJ45_BRAAE|nr:unnamed protein product [Brassicogethes aeneus]